MTVINTTKTGANLMEAFAGESRARNKYICFAEKARAEGYEQIADFFEETAKNELEHAKIWFKLLYGDAIPETPANLIAAACGEHYECTDMYARMAREAREEGYEKIAFLFDAVGKIEEEHEARYVRLFNSVINNRVFNRETPEKWHCMNCGHVYESTDAPEICHVCNDPRSFFRIISASY
jgi:rubrerythrin